MNEYQKNVSHICPVESKKNPQKTHKYRLSEDISVIQTPLCKVVVWCNVLILVVKIQEFCPDCTCCVDFREIVLSFCCQRLIVYVIYLYIIFTSIYQPLTLTILSTFFEHRQSPFQIYVSFFSILSTHR